MESQILHPVSSSANGVEFDFRFKGIASCDALVAIPIGSTLVWEMLLCAQMLGFYDFDLLSVPAFSRGVSRSSRTIISAIDIAFHRHRVSKILNFQTSDYHHLRDQSVSSKCREDADHKAVLINSGKELKERHPGLEPLCVYIRILDAGIAVFSLVDENGVEREILRRQCDIFAPCDGVVVTCMDFRLWREKLSYAWHMHGIRKPTLLSMPGGVKNIIRASRTPMKALRLATSVYAPINGNVIEFAHSGCGAYDAELAPFCGDLYREESYQKGQLEKASDVVTTNFGLASTMVYARSDLQTYTEFVVV